MEEHKTWLHKLFCDLLGWHWLYRYHHHFDSQVFHTCRNCGRSFGFHGPGFVSGDD